MTRHLRFLAATSGLAVAALAASPAFAEGTTAGTTITNQVSLSYKVGGVDQTAITASNSFKVDRKVNLTNASNAPLDFALAVSQLSGGTATHGGTDNFNGTDVKIFRDTNGNGSFDAGTDLEASFLDEVTADQTRRVFVVLNVPLGRATGDVAGVRLTATAAEANSAGSQGAAVTQTAGANTDEVDTVFADAGTSGGNTAYDGIHFDEDDYTILAASLIATKTSRVISDPVNGTTNPKMIPGAVVEYCIAVGNSSGSATAGNLNISDTLPGETDYLSAFGIKLNGTVTGAACNADGASGGSYAAGVVSGTLADLLAGETRTLVFRVTVK
jgi:uncharacterized repeat protein (TIGR01451 family)